MPTPKKHAEIIKAWADGAPIEWRAGQDYEWAAIGEWPGWDDKREYRIKPAAPKWPQTTMTYEQIEAAAYNAPMGAQWRGIANSALKHACESGEVVPADKVREIEAKARAEGMKDGSVWISDRDRMIIRETLKSQGISWTSALVDRVVYRLQK